MLTEYAGRTFHVLLPGHIQPAAILLTAVNAKLTVSCMGFETVTVDVAGNTQLSVVLNKDSLMLNETVVVGYGSIKKSDISGSVASIDKDQMMKRTPINLVQGLQGMAAGVMVSRNSGSPDGESIIRVRGVATVNGSADPLYVVDGVVVGNSSSFLNPADIESIDILKDASATAIYGSRGANGVILITTKKGSEEKASVVFTATVGVHTPSRRIDVGDADEFAYSVRTARANVTNKVKDFLEIGTNVNFTHSESLGGGNVREWAVLTPTMDYVDQLTGQFEARPSYLQNPDRSWPTPS